MIYGVKWKDFFKDLKNEIQEDNVSNGAAALAYYLFLSIFPAAIFLLSVLPYLPIANLDNSIMDLLYQFLPDEAAKMFTGAVNEVISNKKGGLLSLGFLLTLWAASNGMYAIMQQLNITYDVTEGRSYFKARAVSLGLILLFGVFIIGSLALVIFGGLIKSWLVTHLGESSILDIGFEAVRIGIITTGLLAGMAFIYYLGPDVEQKFKFITPGSVFAVAVLGAASIGFRFYVTNFGKYSATYGSIGAVIVMMLWLYITGLVILLGSEINALLEHYNPEGKDKGEKKEPSAA